MANIRIVRFSKPACISGIDPALFLEWTRSQQGLADFLCREKITIPPEADSDPEQIPYSAIAASFMRLNAEEDKELIDALYYLDAVSSEEAADLLYEKVQAANKAKPGKFALPEARPSAVDLALRIWLQEDGKKLVEDVQDRQEIQRFRSFLFFPGTKTATYRRPPQTRFDEAVKTMKVEFSKRKRGNDCKISSYEDVNDDEIWFVIRHGELVNRAENIQDDGEIGISVFRPVTHDVVIYNRALNELRTHVKTKWQQELYKQQFGLLLFEDRDFFGGNAKYTFNPLRDDGEEALGCSGVNGIDDITMREIELMTGAGKDAGYVRYKSNDVFRQWGSQPMPAGTIRRAVFSVKFTYSDKPRNVTLAGTNRLILQRESDGALVQQWLELKKFTLPPSDEEEEAN